MKAHLILPVILAATSFLSIAAEDNTLSTIEKSEGWRLLFNGRDLTGWKGLEFWSAQDGAITGKTTAETRRRPSFTSLIWQGGEVSDFELTCKFKMVSDEPKGSLVSGIQFRGTLIHQGDCSVGGYDADMDRSHSWTGEFKEKQGRNVGVGRGKQAILRDSDDPKKPKIEIVTSIGDSRELKASMKENDWNDYRIKAVGNHIQLYVNGRQTVDVTDETTAAAKSGLLAFGIFYNAMMTAQFKDIKLRELKTNNLARTATPSALDKILTHSRWKIEMEKGKSPWGDLSFAPEREVIRMQGRPGKWVVAGDHRLNFDEFTLSFDQSYNSFVATLPDGTRICTGTRSLPGAAAPSTAKNDVPVRKTPSLPVASGPASSPVTPEQRFYAAIAAMPHVQTGAAGAMGGKDFSLIQPEGGVLVGFDLWQGMYYRELVVGGIRPIFQTGKGRVRGPTFGKGDGNPDKTLEANEGFAVAAVEAVDDKRQVTGLLLQYKRIHYTGFDLEGNGAYKSEWFGQEVGKKVKPKRLDTNGKPALGIFGAADTLLYRVGLIYLDRK